MTTAIPSCLNCRHFNGFWKCKAFPKGIPSEIATGINDHKMPYPGDGGITYEPKDKNDDSWRTNNL